MSTFEEIVSAIRKLPLAERLRLAERVIHEAAGEVPAGAAQEAAEDEQALLIEVNGLLVVSADRTYPASSFDHRAIREERLSKLSGHGYPFAGMLLS